MGKTSQRERAIGYVGECWVWPANKNNRGYGSIRMNGKLLRAHRVIYETFFGLIPDGLVIDHLCNNPSCVNPFHLEPKSHKDNVLRGIGPTAINARKVSCHLGHPLIGNNLYVYPNGRRDCRICRRNAQIRWKENHEK